MKTLLTTSAAVVLALATCLGGCQDDKHEGPIEHNAEETVAAAGRTLQATGQALERAAPVVERVGERLGEGVRVVADAAVQAAREAAPVIERAS
ncbi:MAG: hypothetical protein JWM10_1772, partial [Myxococcaceae bacterium]|nr:hypothetical protein [Myxococcaceae bacterium]